MKSINEYILESKSITNLLIGDVTRFNGAFADVLTFLKNNGYKDIRFFKDGAAPNTGIHRLRLKFEKDCKSDPTKTFEHIKKRFGNNYTYDLYDGSNDEDAEIFIHTKY
jgi:hypothetical protein